MSQRQFNVYAICWAGGDRYLSSEYEGTYYACQKFLAHKRTQGRPTHFNIVSSMPVDRASRRYL